MDVLYGVHPVEEALAAGGAMIAQVLIARERRDERLDALERRCREAGLRVVAQPRAELTRVAKTDQHQGIVAMVRERPVLALEDLIGAPARHRGGQKDAALPAQEGAHRFLLALDGVEDPHNLGALLRSCDGAGVDGCVLTERRSAPLSAVVAKSSAGALEHVRIARVTNLVRSLEQAKERGFWIVGLDERGTQSYTEFDWNADVVLVLGREGAGMHDLVKRTCDHLLRVPMAGKVASLNVSVAGAVVMFEAMRQRREQAARPAAPASEPPRKRQKGLGS